MIVLGILGLAVLVFVLQVLWYGILVFEYEDEYMAGAGVLVLTDLVLMVLLVDKFIEV